VEIDNKLRNYLKRKGVINNKFRREKTLKRRRTKLYHTLTFPTLLHGTENWAIKARDERGITATDIKYERKTAGYTGTNYKTNREFAKELVIHQFWTKYRNTEETGCSISTVCLVLDYRG